MNQLENYFTEDRKIVKTYKFQLMKLDWLRELLEKGDNKDLRKKIIGKQSDYKKSLESYIGKRINLWILGRTDEIKTVLDVYELGRI